MANGKRGTIKQHSNKPIGITQKKKPPPWGRTSAKSPTNLHYWASSASAKRMPLWRFPTDFAANHVFQSRFLDTHHGGHGIVFLIFCFSSNVPQAYLKNPFQKPPAQHPNAPYTTVQVSLAKEP